MSKTVRLPEDLHAELAARKQPDETMAEVIARHLNRPHPEETREMLSGEEATAVADAVDGLYDGESERLARARAAFDTDEETRRDRNGGTDA